MTILFNKDLVREPLYCIVPLFNPWRWKSRIKHLQRALNHFHDSGVVIVLVEAAFNRREFVFDGSGLNGTLANCSIHGEHRHQYIPLRTKDELWLKENLINIGVQALPYNWQNVCWIDGDVHFVRPNWAGECIQQLQHFAFLQMFSQARDLTPGYEMLPETYPHANGISFLRSWWEGSLEASLKFRVAAHMTPGQIADKLRQLAANPSLRDDQEFAAQLAQLEQQMEGDYYGAHRVFPGLAWACTRAAWDHVGGLPDHHIWGGADWTMSHALIGKRANMMHTALHPNYKAMANAWADRCDRYIRRNIGVMEGAVFHSWHGKKTVRGYGDKHRILARVGFDPIAHLKRDANGLYQLADDGSDSYIELRDSFRKLARERNEDSIDI